MCASVGCYWPCVSTSVVRARAYVVRLAVKSEGKSRRRGNTGFAAVKGGLPNKEHTHILTHKDTHAHTHTYDKHSPAGVTEANDRLLALQIPNHGRAVSAGGGQDMLHFPVPGHAGDFVAALCGAGWWGCSLEQKSE